MNLTEEQKRRIAEVREANRETRSEKTYVVIGPHRVNGKSVGEAVLLSLTPSLESALLTAGHIALPSAAQEQPKALVKEKAAPAAKERKVTASG